MLMETTCFRGTVASENSRMGKENQKKKFNPNCSNEGDFPLKNENLGRFRYLHTAGHKNRETLK